MTSAGPVTLNRSYEFELGGQIKSEKTSKLTVTVYLILKKKYNFFICFNNYFFVNCLVSFPENIFTLQANIQEYLHGENKGTPILFS